MTLQIDIIPITPFRQNCTLLWDSNSKEAVFTDVGGDTAYLLNRADELGLNLTAIWLTHGHLDHASGVVEMTAQRPLPVWGPHPDDEFLLHSLPETTRQYGSPVSPAFTPNHWLHDGDSLNVGQYRFEVLHIPGHTPGHVVFYCAEVKLLIAGDVLFYESIGRTDFPRSNHQDLVDHIRRKLFTLPDDTTVVSGHGRLTTIGHEKQHNPFL